MTKLTIKYGTYANALPPQPIRMKTPGWAGEAEAMRDGAAIQPWHCLPFVEGSTYGLELIYPHATECHVVNDNGAVRFDWDFAAEPGGGLGGGEFMFFAPLHAPKYYTFSTRVDVQAPPGHVIRTEPHPRFFTDETGTVPLAMIGHLQNEWYPRQLFVVFRAPWPGRRHIFRQGEPFAQLLFVPHRVTYDLTRLDPEEEAHRRELEQAMLLSRRAIATRCWQNADGGEQDNHYKDLAAAFVRAGNAGVDQAIREASERQDHSLPADKPVAECLAVGAQLVKDQKYRQAELLYTHVLSRAPNNAEALSQLGICFACLGNVPEGVNLMTQATALQPYWPKLHSSLGEILRLLGRFPEAEAEFRTSLQLNPNDPGIVSVLGLTLAQQGRLAEGLQTCRAALTMSYPVPAAHFRLGLVLAQQGHYAEARACYEAALALDPGFTAARRGLEQLAGNSQPGGGRQ